MSGAKRLAQLENGGVDQVTNEDLCSEGEAGESESE